jgi:hypothetical protein
VGAIVHPPQTASVHVAVDLRRAQRAVPEQLLDDAEVGAAFEQVCGERVTEPVRMRDHAPERARVQPAPADREEERVLGAARELRAGIPEVAREPVTGFLAERDDTLLAAFTEDVHSLLVEVHVGEIELDGFPAAQPGRVDELGKRAVAEGNRALALERLQLAIDIAGLLHVRESSRASGCKRDVGHVSWTDSEAEQSAHGCELAGDGRRSEPPRPAPTELRREVGEDASVDVLEDQATLPEPGGEGLEIGAIGATCRIGERCGSEKPLYCCLWTHESVFAARPLVPAG